MRGRNFVEHMAAAFEQQGFPRMPARVLFTMMTADEPGLTARELADRLDVSPAAISGALRYLLQIGMLIREPVVGSRRDRYRMPEHTWYTVSFQKGPEYRKLAGMIGKGIDELGADTVPGQRVAEMRDFFIFIADNFEVLLTRWKASRRDMDEVDG